MGEEARASHCRALPRVIIQQQPWPRLLLRGAKKDKIDCFVFRASSHIPIPRLLSLSVRLGNGETGLLYAEN